MILVTTPRVALTTLHIATTLVTPRTAPTTLTSLGSLLLLLVPWTRCTPRCRGSTTAKLLALAPAHWTSAVAHAHSTAHLSTTHIASTVHATSHLSTTHIASTVHATS